jgi:hypothetical protein
VTRLTALDALGRGIANVRGNLEVVLASAAGSIAVLAVVVLSLVPWLGSGAGELVRRFTAAGADVPDPAAIFGRSLAAVSDLWGLILAVGVGLTAASVVYAWYFGGLLGVLAAGDAQAPPGTGRGSELFRTWSLRFFFGEASRLVWRVLLFYSLVLAILLVVLVGFVVLIGAVAATAASSGSSIALLLGCGGLLPLTFAFFVVAAALSLGQVVLVRPSSSVLAATRTGFSLVGRRLGAVLALYALLIVASIVVGVLEMAAGFLAGLLFVGVPALATGAQIALFVVQLLVGALINLVFVAAFVALVRGEQALAADAA